VRAISTNLGITTTLAGVGSAAEVHGDHRDGHASIAQFRFPYALTMDPNGTYLYVSDRNDNRIRKIRIPKDYAGGLSDEITTVAGVGHPGKNNGFGNRAAFNAPSGMSFGLQDNFTGPVLFVADTLNHMIRRIVLSNNFVTTVSGNGKPGYRDGRLQEAQFNKPYDIAVRPDGNSIYVADTGNNCIRLISFKYQFVKGTGYQKSVRTFAGNQRPGASDGPLLQASFFEPISLALSSDATALFVSEAAGKRIRVIHFADPMYVTTVAGSRECGLSPSHHLPLTQFNSIDGVGTAACFDSPAGEPVCPQRLR
jgi:DNA-binding beta-propeller fold protein YncE